MTQSNQIIQKEILTKMSSIQGFRSGFGGIEKVLGVSSFEDIENVILRGSGLSASTYRVYASNIRLLWTFSSGLNPLQIDPALVEAFFDHSVKETSAVTARNRIAGIKKYLECVERLVPGWESPFRYMDERLKKKLAKTPHPEKRRALTATETKRLLLHLKQKKNLRALQKLAIVELLLGSGLRASEACGLRWQDVELDEDTELHYLNGVGKGGKPFCVELMMPEALEHLKAVFKKQFRREPKPEEHLFIREPKYKAYMFSKGAGAGVKVSIRRPFTPDDLWFLVKEIGREAGDYVVHSSKQVIWSPHMLRRSCASILAKQGCSVVQIQRYLRHASAATTLAHYVCDDEPLSPALKRALA